MSKRQSPLRGNAAGGSPLASAAVVAYEQLQNNDLGQSGLTTLVEPGPEALVFTSPMGSVLRRHNFGGRVWKPAVRAAALDGLRMHDLRHTAAALMIAVNESPELVKRQLGHSSIEVTFDVYGHLFPSSIDNLVGGLDRLYREAQTG